MTAFFIQCILCAYAKTGESQSWRFGETDPGRVINENVAV